MKPVTRQMRNGCETAIHAGARSLLSDGPHATCVLRELGAPKQGLWAARRARPLAPAIRRQAPRWMQRADIEWLHRLSSEPRRLGWRYINTNTRFILIYAVEAIRKRHGATN
jgi:UDP-N-acetyl-D-mannosaminuronic acid transferase (WecB/TagA/CpsF family)